MNCPGISFPDALVKAKLGIRAKMRVTAHLTVKLRGRIEAPEWSRGCTLSSRTGGDTTDSHGPLQRLLDRGLASWAPLLFTRNPVMVAIHLHVRTMLKEVLGFGARGHLGTVGAPVALKRRFIVLRTVGSLKTARLRRGRSLGGGRSFGAVSGRVSPNCYENDNQRY